jgi:hypothetical protein
LTPVFSNFADVFGDSLPAGLQQIPTLIAAYMQLRLTQDLNIKDDASLYQRYMAGVIAIPGLVLIELTAANQRMAGLSAAAATRALKVYASHRSGKIPSPVPRLPLPTNLEKSISLVADELNEDDVIERIDEEQQAEEGESAEARTWTEILDQPVGRAIEETEASKGLRQRKERALSSLYLASGAGGVCDALLAINERSQSRNLLSHFSEEHQERALKAPKAFVRQSSPMHYVMTAGFILDAVRLEKAAAAPLLRRAAWTGLSRVIVAQCYLTQLSVAEFNIAEILRRLDAFPDCLWHLSGSLLIEVGPPGPEQVVLCACGNAEHANDLRQSQAWERWDSWLLSNFPKPADPVPIPSMEEGLRTLREIVTQYRANQDTVREKELLAAKHDTVLQLWTRLGYVNDRAKSVTASRMALFLKTNKQLLKVVFEDEDEDPRYMDDLEDQVDCVVEYADVIDWKPAQAKQPKKRHYR